MEMMGLDSDCLGSGKSFPPGFRFHPTDEELVLFYLKRKICGKRYGLDVISETDVYKFDPEEFPGISKLKTGDRQWFFFSPRDRKYPNGGRCNRATTHGYWKATGKDRIITCRSRSVGNKKTLVFYRGRAPRGERTNWVMHEYTLDENELKRCPPPLDYFALYKAYKKSGSGPKNGEEYGALFREEDWEEDNVEVQVQVQLPIDQDSPESRVNAIELVDNSIPFDDQQKSLLDDLEEIMNQLANEELPNEPCGLDFGYDSGQVTVQEVTRSTLIDDLSNDVPVPTLQTQCQMTFLQASFESGGSGRIQTQINDVPEVLNANQLDHSIPVEDFFEDFLEMDDLNGPEPTGQNFDGFTEFDLFQDDSEFVPALGLGESAEIPQQYVNNLGNEFTSPVSGIYANNDCAAVNYPLNPQSNSSNATIPQFWTDEQRFSMFPSSNANSGSFPPSTTGLMYQNQNMDFELETLATNENGSNKQDGGKDSWFSSALWAFVESIPTTPASASDCVLVTRAFERMSSFSRVSLNTRSTNPTVACGATSSPRISGKLYRSRFTCFFLVGVLCAVLWAMTRTSVTVLS